MNLKAERRHAGTSWGPLKDWNFQASKFSNGKQTIPLSLTKFTNSSHKIHFNSQLLAMAGRRIAYVGLPVVAIGGYYFYAAGGDSKVAQKKAERLFTDNHKDQATS